MSLTSGKDNYSSKMRMRTKRTAVAADSKLKTETLLAISFLSICHTNCTKKSKINCAVQVGNNLWIRIHVQQIPLCNFELDFFMQFQISSA